MGSVETIERVLASGLLVNELIVIPPEGATPEEIELEEELAGRKFSEQHVAILRRWNGLDLDVLRFFGCSLRDGSTIAQSTGQLGNSCANCITLASDPSGFLYLEDADGGIWSYDMDGGAKTRLADNLDDFLGRLVFGQDASQFGGDDWAEEVREAGFFDGR